MNDFPNIRRYLKYFEDILRVRDREFFPFEIVTKRHKWHLEFFIFRKDVCIYKAQSISKEPEVWLWKEIEDELSEKIIMDLVMFGLSSCIETAERHDKEKFNLNTNKDE